MTVLLIVFLFFILSWYVRFYWKWRKGPSGPIPIPVLGNLIQMGIAGMGVPTPNLAISKLTEKYGDIFRLSIGLTDYIVLGSHEAMVDIRNRKEAQGRLLLGMIWDRNEGQNSGIAFAEGPFHETTKKFVFNNLHKMGLNKIGGLEELVQGTASQIVKDWESRLDDQKTAVIHDLPRLGKYAASIVLKFVLGEHFLDSPKYDAHFDKGIQATEEWARAGFFGAGLDQALPFLRHVFPSLVEKEMTERTIGVLRRMAQDLLDDLRMENSENNNTVSPKSNPTLAELYLDKIDSGTDPSLFSDFHFQSLFADMFQAAYETQSGTLRALLLFCILHQEAQSRIWEEIQSVVGKDEPVRMEHLKRMSFTEAFILESARHMIIVTQYIPTKLTSDIKVGEWVIPKGTGILSDVHSVHFNSKVWTNPYEFDPDRFLTPEGSRKKRFVAPFGIGKRSCPGETIADGVVFIFFVSFLKAFKVTAVPGRGAPRFEIEVGISATPVPFDMVIEERVW